mmetsp:Transcript_17850/g.59791  ORF Transcript_17850/g.59791 Transcript_17850/m.59791 type:complete len:210 (+) Transcript_17850:348-977(+)
MSSLAARRRPPPPARLPAHFPAHLPAHLPNCFPFHLPAALPPCLPPCLPHLCASRAAIRTARAVLSPAALRSLPRPLKTSPMHLTGCRTTLGAMKGSRPWPSESDKRLTAPMMLGGAERSESRTGPPPTRARRPRTTTPWASSAGGLEQLNSAPSRARPSGAIVMSRTVTRSSRSASPLMPMRSPLSGRRRRRELGASARDVSTAPRRE